jgi:N-acetylmuramoyl-L-alanine amidase
MNEGSYKGLRIISIALLMTVTAAFNPTPFTEENEGVNIIVIDPGHGGKDPGNLGTGRYKDKEKDVSYDVSVLVKQYIEQYLPDTKAILTRNDNEFIELYQRAVIANRANADLFISIHCNANDARSAYGTESFVLGMGERDQRLNKTAQLENSARLLEDNWESNYESLDASNPAAIIALRAYQDAYLEQSISIADEIQNQFQTRVKRRNRGVKQQPLAVLRGSTMPAVLVELGFLTNPGEEDFLQGARGKELLASAIFRAIKSYKYKRESRDALMNEESILEDIIDSELANTSEEEPLLSSQEEKIDSKNSADEQAETNARGLNSLPTFINGISYSVQIAVSRNDLPLKPENFMGLSNVYKKDVYGLYKYYFGKVHSYQKAIELKTVAQQHYPDAYIVAFEGTQKIKVQEAKKVAP